MGTGTRRLLRAVTAALLIGTVFRAELERAAAWMRDATGWTETACEVAVFDCLADRERRLLADRDRLRAAVASAELGARVIDAEEARLRDKLEATLAHEALLRQRVAAMRAHGFESGEFQGARLRRRDVEWRLRDLDEESRHLAALLERQLIPVRGRLAEARARAARAETTVASTLAALQAERATLQATRAFDGARRLLGEVTRAQTLLEDAAGGLAAAVRGTAEFSARTP
jgi:hypothetical protein